MNGLKKALEFRFERTIPASPDKVYDAWLNPKIPGNPWSSVEKLILDPKADGLFYWRKPGMYHYGYGRFTKTERPDRIQYTWVSPDTMGVESTVTVTFRKQGEETLMTLVHSDIPDTDEGRGFEKGWNYFLNIFPGQFADVPGKKNYTATIEVARSPEDVFRLILEVSKWWTKDIEGESTKLNDEFVIRHGDRHYSKHKLVEVVPGRKIVWLVNDSALNWIEKNKSEWTGTKLVFEIAAKGDRSVIHFTHEGLIPEKECYARCEQSWNTVIKEWLFNFITDGKAI